MALLRFSASVIFSLLFFSAIPAETLTFSNGEDPLIRQVVDGEDLSSWNPQLLSAEQHFSDLTPAEFKRKFLGLRSLGLPKDANQGYAVFPFPVQDDEISAEVFHSPEVFKRDYAEMEKKFKIFVYPDGGSGAVSDFPGQLEGKYASEGFFFQNFNESGFSTEDPKEAHLFFIPISAHILRGQGQSPRDVIETVHNFVRRLITEYPYWNRTLGADHVFVACHQSGIDATENILHLMNSSIRILCSSSQDAKYIPYKDISLPQTIRPFTFPAGGNFVENRTILGYWAGSRTSKLRDTLINLWQNDTELDIQKYILDTSLKGRLLYQEKFFRSKFCICPSGSKVHAARISTAIHYGCVPVILADNYNLPFNDILDWQKFSVILRENDVYDLKEILEKIPDATYKAMQINTIRVQKHFEWKSPSVRFDPFHLVMYELWKHRHSLKF